MTVFVSHSSRDASALDGLLTALRQAREQVWIDEELGGGEQWWRSILEQIRKCDVFIVALSENWLRSKPCSAELSYAQSLGKPILPAQVGSVDSMRANPLGTMQIINYQAPTIATGIQLISALHEQRAKLLPLPEPLPEEPAVPFAYLMRAASTITSPQLNAQQQILLVSELKAGLDEDGGDADARRDIAQLLRSLRDRPDVTWRTRTEVDALLGSMGMQSDSSRRPQSGWPTGVQYSYSTAPPQGSAPHGFPPDSATALNLRRSKTKWYVTGGAAVAAAAVAAITFVSLGSGTEPTSAPPPTGDQTSPIAPPEIGLPHDSEIAQIMGANANDITRNKSFTDLSALDTGITKCNPAFFIIDVGVYGDSGYSEVISRFLKIKNPNGGAQISVDESVASFPTSAQASVVLNRSRDRWQACQGLTTTESIDGREFRWTFGQPTVSDTQIQQVITQEAADGRACQHVMRTVSEMVIEVMTCDDKIADQANLIVDKIAAKMTE